MTKKLLITLLLLTIMSGLMAQTGIVRGKVTDAETGEELIGATVLVEGTMTGASADLDGNYSIDMAPVGIQTLKVQYISYETQMITGVEVIEGKVLILDIKLKPVSVGLDEVIITAKAVLNTESALLTLQRKSATVMDGISAQQISKAGDSDAAGAVSRITGVSVEGGKYVYVRGLGDRYSQTILNGCQIPSLDPERNTVQMDVFPTSAIENIVVYKSFSPNLNAFTGGLINIVTKDFPEQLSVSFSAKFEYNTQASLNNDFLSYEGGNTDWIGIDDGTRNWPVTPQEIPLYPTKRDKLDEITMSFNKIMDPTPKRSFLNQSYGFFIGNQTTLFNRPLGFNIGLSYKNEFNAYDDGERGLYKLTAADANALNKEQQYNETAGQYESFVGGLVNLNYKLSPKHKVGYVLLYNHSGQKHAFYQYGQKPSDEIGMFIQNRELSYEERSILANQFKGSHAPGDANGLKIDWIISYTISKQNEPDLRFFTNSYYPDAVGDAQYEINPSKYKVPSRYNRSMDEWNLDNKLDFELPFTFLGDKSKFKFGGAYTYKNREFREEKIAYLAQVQYYNGDVSEYLADENIGQNNPLYDPVTRENYGLYVQDATDQRNSYDGYQSLIGAYAMVDLPLLKKLRMEAGLRYEANDMVTESLKTSIEKGELNDHDILPAINLTYTLIASMNLRFAYTRTLSRPTFREIAPFASFSPVAPTIVGNPELKRTLIDNFDLKWEYFFKPGEIVSFGLFYKNFINPIEMVDNPVAVNPEISYQNVDNAKNYGFEVDFRKKLDFMNVLRNMSFGLNFAYIRSEVTIDPQELESIRALDPDHPDSRPLFGQAPYIVNALLAYANNEIGLSANLIYNVTGPRISLVTKGGTPEVFQQPFNGLDFNISKTIGKYFTLTVNADNLLNSINKEVYTYKDIDYSFFEYSTGRTFGVKLAYNFK